MGFGGSEIQIVGNVFQCRRRNVIMSARAKTQFGVLLHTARLRSLHGRATITTDGCSGGVVAKVEGDVSGVWRYTGALIEWNYNNLRRRKSCQEKPSYYTENTML